MKHAGCYARCALRDEGLATTFASPLSPALKSDNGCGMVGRPGIVEAAR